MTKLPSLTVHFNDLILINQDLHLKVRMRFESKHAFRVGTCLTSLDGWRWRYAPRCTSGSPPEWTRCPGWNTTCSNARSGVADSWHFGTESDPNPDLQHWLGYASTIAEEKKEKRKQEEKTVWRMRRGETLTMLHFVTPWPTTVHKVRYPNTVKFCKQICPGEHFII